MTTHEKMELAHVVDVVVATCYCCTSHHKMMNGTSRSAANVLRMAQQKLDVLCKFNSRFWLMTPMNFYLVGGVVLFISPVESLSLSSSVCDCDDHSRNMRRTGCCQGNWAIIGAGLLINRNTLTEAMCFLKALVVGPAR